MRKTDSRCAPFKPRRRYMSEGVSPEYGWCAWMGDCKDGDVRFVRYSFGHPGNTKATVGWSADRRRFAVESYVRGGKPRLFRAGWRHAMLYGAIRGYSLGLLRIQR